ncbi:hypothetical protein Nepgr_008290 [Nepenthes gracilis]|uniref:Phototropic-responsive NPH3 family protein n=1 Tax=Nepenthes gracilis TaxID=150966 RepID=A0AAD3XJ88_NEPGR|nr:hypothetical protein Nepgr_008290 [Nepenthes gracilis]
MSICAGSEFLDSNHFGLLYIVAISRNIMEAEKSTSRGQAWFCTTGLPSDIVVEVDDMTFHLHKFPLISKSKKLHDLIADQEANDATVQTLYESSEKGKEKAGGGGGGSGENEDFEPEIKQKYCHISLPDFPGSSEAFETAAKFCYGVKINLSASNVAPLRCAGEVLEMTEEFSEDNLISKTERFLSDSVFRNMKDSIKALKSCEVAMPLAETLGVVQRCIDAISSRAALVDPSLFGWPVNDIPAVESLKRATPSKSKGVGVEPWFEDLSLLSLDFFKRLILAMRERDLNPDLIENCLIHYAKKSFPEITRSNRKPSLSSIASEAEQRELLETIIANIPLERSSRTSTATRFLFGLLRTAHILNVSEACKATLERKIGAQLEQATLDDLLIPSYSYLNETLYDVDCVQRILGHFLDSLEERDVEDDGANVGHARSPAIMLVGKLIDGYLAEIASDGNLKPERFYELAISLPDQARLFDDGLYRAVDVYLKAHPWISEAEREKVCGVMACQKLTLEACTHAAQNERLPLRAVVQVLFFEQLQLRHAIAGTLLASEAAPLDSGEPLVRGGYEERGGRETPTAQQSSTTWRTAIRENQVLRLDMDSMRARVNELERQCSTMKKAIEKIDKLGGGGGWRSSVGRKFGCKFKSQVCDSHEPAVVEARKGRQQSNQPRPS